MKESRDGRQGGAPDEVRGFRVRGRVQGVGFRWSAARVAQGLGLRGAIRNAADGTVEVTAAGSAEHVERFRRWLGDGPRGSVVEGVDEAEPTLPLPAQGFEIVR